MKRNKTESDKEIKPHKQKLLPVVSPHDAVNRMFLAVSAMKRVLKFHPSLKFTFHKISE